MSTNIPLKSRTRAPSAPITGPSIDDSGIVTGAVSIDPTTGRTVVVDAEGRTRTRKRAGTDDPYFIDPAIIPHGYVYQWKRHSTFNAEDTSHMVDVQENGWAPVPSSRHQGMFMPEGYSGAIIRNGMILMDCPAQLVEEARDEERRKANAPIHAALQNFKLDTRFDTSAPNARQASFVRREIGSVPLE